MATKAKKTDAKAAETPGKNHREIVASYHIVEISPKGTVIGKVGGNYDTEKEAQAALDRLNSK